MTRPRTSQDRRACVFEYLYLHHVEEHFLAEAVLLLEEFVLWVRSSDVSADELFAGRGHLQEFGVLILNGQVLGIAQQLPHYRPKVVRNSFPDKFLVRKKKTTGNLKTLRI